MNRPIKVIVSFTCSSLKHNCQ